MSVTAVPRGLGSLLSPLTGAVTALDERLLEPADALLHSAWCTLSAGTADDGPAVRAGGGWSPSARAARAAAAGEAVERASAAHVPDDLVLASAEELGPAALDPARVRLFLGGQIAGTPYAQLTPRTRVRWVRARRLPDGAEAWVPAQLVFLAGMPDDPPEPLLTVPTSSGLACAPTRERALLSALLELVERDAFSLAWASRLSLPHLTWEGNAALESLVRERLASTGLAFAAIDLSAFLDTPVALAVVTTPSGLPGPTAVGAAAATTDEDAAARALAEGFAAFAAARALAATRDADFEPDGSGLDSFDDRVLFYADPARAGALSFLAASRERRHVDDVPPLVPGLPAATGPDVDRAVNALCDRLFARGAVAYAVDVTAPDVAAAGLHVVRVVCPELCPLDALHALRFLGVPRLLTGAWDAGLLQRPLTVEEVNSDPHPFP